MPKKWESCVRQVKAENLGKPPAKKVNAYAV